MREIKFRAWDKESNKMLNVGLIDFRYTQAWFPELITKESPYGSLMSSKFELMQFTGLKDKNGKEIYEGDLFKWAGNEIVKVVFRDACFGFVSNERFISFEHYPEDVECVSTVRWLEVIGNIYENKELLDGRQTLRQDS